MMKWNGIWVLLVGLSVALASGCKDEEDAEADAPSAPRSVPVETVSAAARTLRESIISTATVDSKSAVDVVAEVPGVVITLDTEQGETVKKGQRIAQIQREEVNFGVSSAKTAVQRLESEVERLRPLYDKGVISRQVFDEAQWRLQEARSEQKRASMAASDLRAVAPMAGVVAMRYVNLGQQVATGTPLFRIVDPEELIVAVNLPENSLGKIFEGQEAYVESDALPDQTFNGKVERISPVVDPRTGTLRVQLSLDEAAAKTLKPGMFVKAHIVVSQRPDAVAIPRRAVVFTDDQSNVFVVEDKTALRKPVKLGVNDGTWVEILSGINMGDKVVVLGQEGLKSGTPVDAVEREGG